MKSSFFALAHLAICFAFCGCSAETKPVANSEIRGNPDPIKEKKTPVLDEKRKGIDPDDPSIVYSEPFVMNSGKKSFNGKAYERTSLWIDAKTKLVPPDEQTEVVRLDDGNDVVVFLEKWMDHGGHGDQSNWPVTSHRSKLGCAVKLEKGELLIGTFGESSYKEGGESIRLVVHVPRKVEVSRRAGLVGSRGDGSSERTSALINPAPGKPKPILTKKKKEGRPESWLPPTVEDGWHEIPVTADSERRASKE